VITFRSSAKFDKKGAIVLCDMKQVKNKKFSFNKKAIKDDIVKVVAAGQFEGESGQVFPIISQKKTILFVGAGGKDASLTKLRIDVRSALQSSYLKAIKDVEIIAHTQNDSIICSIIEAVLLGTYSWDKYKTKPKKDKSVKDKTITLATQKKKIYEDAITICEGTNLTRNLINDNADTITSAYLEKEIRKIVKGKKNISLEILNKAQMKAKGLGLHLAVNQSSPNEPKLIIVKYNGASKKGPYAALIGKGMTFDTGGLNLKPSGHIESMRLDMSGAAAVIGTLKNVIALKTKKNILFTCTIAENVTGATSYKPGEVIRGYSGKTVEIGNTDAEGRLVLADAISYLVKNYKPNKIIDIATLTGACIVALGLDYTGLVTTDGDVWSISITCVNLPWTSDFSFSIFFHFLPVGNPTRHPTNGKQNGDHLCWNSNGFVNKSTIKINIRIQFSFGEIIIF